MKLSIIIPVYNEEKTVAQILRQVMDIDLGEKIEKEIIVVDDGSFDTTAQILKHPDFKKLKVIRHKNNLGKGAAVRTGFKVSTGELLIIQDADLEYNPEDFTRLIEPIIDNGAKVVYGTRLKNYEVKLWGKDKTPLLSHWFGNKLLTFLTNLLYRSNLTDMETCYKLFTKEALKDLKLKSNRFEIEPEITAKVLKRGYKIVEVPIKVTPRSHKEGKKIHSRDGIIAVITLIKYRFKN